MKNNFLIVFVFFFFSSLFSSRIYSQTYTDNTPGTNSFVVPCDVTSITVEAWGAGGAGGAADNNSNGGSGGGGGGYASRTITVTPGQVITYTVGAGGNGGNNNGQDGQSSSILTLTANGGTGGSQNEGNPGNGGTATGGTTNNTGGNGIRGIDNVLSTIGGAGGNGANGGAGGATLLFGSSNGNNGTGPGGAGGGARRVSNTGGRRQGGDGANGQIRITYTSTLQSYCTPSFTGGIWPITNVTFSGINNTTSNTINGGTPDYESFCNTADVITSFSYPFSMKANAGFGNNFYAVVYADWNQNGNFGDNANEIYSIGLINNSTGVDAAVFTTSIAVPATAVAGFTKLRVMYNFGSSPTNPCQTGNGYGQAEDYVIKVTAAAPPTITSFTPTSGCVGSTFTITGTNFTGTTTVTIGGTNATSFTVNSATSITATAGTGTTGVVRVTTPAGTATSFGIYTILATPTITSQPVSTLICKPGNGSFSVTATGATTYQWRRNGVNLTNTAPYSGVNTATLTLTDPALAIAGTFDVVVGNGFCSVTSNSATLTIDTTPIITSQPTATTICESGSGTFSVINTGAITYQWRRNGVNLTNVAPYSNVNTATLNITNPTAGIAGNFDVILTSTSGCSTTSSVAALTVISTPANPSNPTSNSPQCNPAGVTLTRSGTPPAGETWYWQTAIGGTNTTNSGNTFTVNTTGTYYIRSRNNTTGCWSNGEGSLAVVVNNSPTAVANTPSPTDSTSGICYLGSGAVTSISWAAVPSATSYDVYFGAGSLPVVLTANVATNSYNTGALSASTTYYWKVVPRNSCGITSGTPIVWNFTTNDKPCYCTSSGSSNSEGITGVQFNTINNVGTAVNTDYSNFTAITTTVLKGSIYNLNVSINTGGNFTFYQTVWIDWNGNGLFTDAGESYNLGTAVNVTNGLSSLCPRAITIPAGAITGQTRMRIQSNRTSSTGGSCDNGFRGEVEDYTLNIIPPSPCATPSAQPTSLVLSPTGTFISGSFTPASPAPNNYLVVYNTTGNTPSPSNSTTYNIGGTVGAGNIVVSNDNSTTFTIAGLNNSTTYYVFVFSYNSFCTGGPRYNTTTPLTAFTTTNTQNYCTPSVTPGLQSSNYITQVDFVGNLTNSSNTSTFSTNPAGFQDFASLTPKASQAQGEGVNIFVDTNRNSAVFMKAWVDWNKDNSFDNTTEIVYQSTSGFLNTTFGFIVPATATPGDYRIRIRINTGSNTFNSCGILNSGGETEDYTFTVIANCAAKIQTIASATRCGTGSVTLGATGTAGTTQYRWYSAKTGGILVGTSNTTTWNTPSISTKTAYYVTAFNGTCESLFRTEVIANVNPVSTITFTTSNPEVCGEDSIIALSANTTTEQVYLINENFESGLGVFTNNSIATPNASITNWQTRSSTYVPPYPTYPVWYPAVSSGFSPNQFVMSTSDLSTGGSSFGKVETALQSATVNTTGFLNLTLSFRMYFSSYYDANSAATEFVTIEYKNGAGAWTAVPSGLFLSDVGIGTQFATQTFNLSPYVGIPSFQIRFRYKAGWCDGVAIDDVQLFGDRALTPAFTWTSGLPVDAYIDAACTIPYTSTPITTVYIKPTIAQLETPSYSFTANANLSNGCTTSSTINVTNKTKVWKGTSSTNWNDPNNWLPIGVPDINTCVIISNTGISSTLSTTPNGIGKNLTIKPGGVLNIQNNNALTIKEFVVNNGIFNLANNTSLIQIDNVLNSGTGSSVMNRQTVTSNAYDYIYYSSPVNNFSVANIPGSPKYIWLPTVNRAPTYPSNFGNWTNASGNMTIGKGYISRQGAPGIKTVNFTGTFNNGNISSIISRGTYNGINYTGPTTTPVTKDDDNLNLLGNPYPSAINAIDFLTANTNLEGFVKIWTHGSAVSSSTSSPFYQNFQSNYSINDYITYNSSGSSSGPGVFGGYIASGQGFFVQMLHTTGATTESVTFTNAMRNGSYSNSQFYRNGNEESIEHNRIWLDLAKQDGNSVRTLVGYITDATNNLDRLYDAKSVDKNYFDIYSINDNERLNIQGRALPFENNDLVPIGVYIPQNGNYTIGIGAVDGLFTDNNQGIYLEDIQTGIIHDLRITPYSFTENSGNIDNRFVLRYTNSNTLENPNFSNDENEVLILTSENLTIKSILKNIISIEIHDILGRNFVTINQVNSLEKEVKNLQKNNAPLLIKIKLENGSIVNKKIVF